MKDTYQLTIVFNVLANGIVEAKGLAEDILDVVSCQVDNKSLFNALDGVEIEDVSRIVFIEEEEDD